MQPQQNNLDQVTVQVVQRLRHGHLRLTDYLPRGHAGRLRDPPEGDPTLPVSLDCLVYPPPGESRVKQPPDVLGAVYPPLAANAYISSRVSSGSLAVTVLEPPFHDYERIHYGRI